MAKPTILAVDDEAIVLRSIVRDLRHRYGSDYRILFAEGGGDALEALRELKLRDEPVALLVSDQRMPGIAGVDLLQQAMDIHPKAKRVLLTAYADTDAAIRAINKAHVDLYLVKPWDPPEEKLYPDLDDLLNEWDRGYVPEFKGIKIIDHRWSPKSHQLKDFLGRNQVPYRWLNIESDPEAKEILRHVGQMDCQLPLVLFTDGSYLVQPELADVAEKAGLRARAESLFYDLVIVGAGPAGLAAAVYGASEGLRTLMVEGQAPGGQAGTSSRIENYLGFPSGLSGDDLARRAVIQATKFGAEILTPKHATRLRVDNLYRFVTLSDGSELSCRAVMIATGVSYRVLDIPGAQELTGRGVYYGAALSEAMSVKDEQVFIVGGGNSAGQAAMYLAQHAPSVTLIVRGDAIQKGMSRYLVDQLEATRNVRVRLNTEVVAAHGDRNLTGLTLMNRQTMQCEEVAASALFVLIGAEPQTDWLEGVVRRDPHGFILTGSDVLSDGRPPKGWNRARPPFLLETSVPGVFAAGDARHGSVKRVASGVGEGAIAISFIHQYLADQ